MKKLLVILFLASFGFGFTLNDGENVKGYSQCPYLNKIYKMADSENVGCPYILGLMESSKSPRDVCPYLDSREIENGGCPYLNGIESQESEQQVIFENTSI